jgi:serine/threonine protein kinase
LLPLPPPPGMPPLPQVALKRIPDVLNSIDNAKRVLREVCILRRLEHPNIIRLKDVFLKPSATGATPQGLHMPCVVPCACMV